MKKLIILLLLTFSYHFGFAQFPDKPSSYALINDLTGSTLTTDQIQTLDRKLKIFEDSTTNQVTVVIMKSVGDYDINDYTQQLGRKWGIGGKAKNNGVILLVAIGDRKMSIQTGYGLEGALPDIYTKRIIENDIKPFFKDGNYYAGIDAGTNSIISLIKGEYKSDNPKAKSKSRNRGGAGFIVIIIIIIIAVIIRRGGGRGGNQVIGGRGVAEALLFGALLGGGRSSGGGWGGGGGGGGGFGSGGFGGGSFGGGGSSGSW
jgi:uncharacterized protein